MSLSHFDPLANLRLFEDAFTRVLAEPQTNRPWSPSVDIYETENELVLKADLPDVDLKDIDVRVNGLEHGDAEAYAVDAHEISPGVVYRDDRVTVTAFPVHHGSWDEAFGYRFETPDRRVVISGDTAPCDEVVRACDGCDVLVHEVYSRAGFDRLDPADQRYHAAFHTSAPELARIATAARPGTLVLYHQLFFGTPEGSLVEEVHAGYGGEVVSAHDLQVF